MAEILSVRNAEKGIEHAEFYVHYLRLNKRLDEWVSYSRLRVSETEFPKPKKPPPTTPRPAGKSQPLRGEKGKFEKQTPSSKSSTKKKSSKLDSVGTPQIVSTPVAGSSQMITEDTDDLPLSEVVSKKRERSMDLVDEPVGFVQEPSSIERKDSTTLTDDDIEMEDANNTDPQSATITDETFSKEKELEKLRTSGSMTQSNTEISRVKNIKQIIMGKAILETWYFSPYPEEFTNVDSVYLCEFCLEPYGSAKQFERHRQKCTLRHPPGNEIYRDTHNKISFFEIDGRKQRRYCRNLCLLSKLFLDHKTLYFDVDPFLFYLMTRNDDSGCHLLGYFSKEKQSAENYNVACILTLPQHQRMGYGKLLIAFSYELSKIEQKTGSPEKPLSDLGLLSYRSYWSEVLIERFMGNKAEASVMELSEETGFTTEDILSTLVETDMLRVSRTGYCIAVMDEHVEQYYKSRKRGKLRIDPGLIDWTPPRFAPNQLRFL
ncbi:Histone acetyltransferase [Nowakowskiella sp. JEL0407]|nr:Histone acetyltransferase [Nowakowskiella sp. JEL0407]